jgi:vesicle-associated membrane protein 7
MTIVYALVARKRVVLAEHTLASGNFPTVTRVLLAKIPDQDGKMSYVYDQHVFHYIVQDGMTFLCMASEETRRRVTFAFLEEVIQAWRKEYSGIEQTALAFSCNDGFGPVLKAKMQHYSNSPSADNIAVVQARIDSVKDIMVENIDKVLERGEKIELLVDKTDRLNQTAYKFEKSSRTLKNEMYWRGIRNKVIILVIILLLIFFVIVMVCGIDFKSCGKDSNDSSN